MDICVRNVVSNQQYKGGDITHKSLAPRPIFIFPIDLSLRKYSATQVNWATMPPNNPEHILSNAGTDTNYRLWQAIM